MTVLRITNYELRMMNPQSAIRNMSIKRFTFFSVFVLGIALLGQGCFGSGTSSTSGPDGGVYKTSDRAETWAQKRILLKGPQAVSLGNDVVVSMALDPQDRQAVYAGMAERGIVYSLNGGDSWEEITEGPKGRIQSVAVDPKDKCTIYAAMGNKIFKTENCHRDWKEMFFDPKTDKTFTVVAVDWFNPTIVYAGTDEGDIFKSTDAGLSWLVSKRADAPVTSILLDPHDSRTVYVGTNGDGIMKTMDGGNTWIRIRAQLNDFRNARRVITIVADEQSDPTVLYLASDYGITRSADGGETWEALQLVSEPNDVDIVGMALNPRNNKELQYITPNTIVISSDGGQTWNARQLPSARPATTLLVDPEDGNILYVGFGATKK